jgi:putative sigma-54 modulation protein
MKHGSPMRIEIVDDASISRQARIYAEYRLFDALSHVVDTARVRSASLELRRAKSKRHCGTVSCTVTVELNGGEVSRFRAAADHPYAAINRAVGRLRLNARPVRHDASAREWPPRSDGVILATPVRHGSVAYQRRQSRMDLPVEFFVRGSRADTTEALREYAARRLSFAVRRFTRLVRHLTVRLVDENGPRRGPDTRCSITADLADRGQLFVAATAAWPFAAITLAAGRLSEALRREAGRHAAHRSGPVGTSHHKSAGHLRGS